MNAQPVNVLLVSDSIDSRDGVAEYLTEQGMEIQVRSRGIPALAGCQSADIIMLELRLPDIDGLELCRLIRLKSRVPIFVMADKNDEFDHVLSLKMGADGFIARPFRRRELVARIEAAIRRARWSIVASPEATCLEPNVKVIGDITIDLRNYRVTVDGEEISLTPKEFDLLALLAKNPGRVYTREQIMAEVWLSEGVRSNSRTLGVHMTSLRKKISKPGLIKTVRGVGFSLIRSSE
jgi:two-component system, OmpR family, response regulator RegX3